MYLFNYAQNRSQVKYYKGLGTSTSKEAKEYFSDMDRHRIPFHYAGPGDDDAILLVGGCGEGVGWFPC